MNPHSTQILTKQIELDNKLENHISIKYKISRLFNNPKLYAISTDYTNPESNEKKVLEHTSCSNGFAAAVIHAYNYHKHLRLSPDDIWLTISQGVSQHINYNSEKFRHKFVRHEGQKEIFILVDGIISPSTLEGDWPEVVNRLVIKTDENVEKIELKELLECNFSTTTSSSLTASRIVLLDVVKKYFKYGIGFMCGIPKITLEGTLEDWMKLQEKIIHLRNLNLELNFWLDRLEPVICKLIETYRGEIDEEFWSKIIKINQMFGSGGGGSYITGWLTSLFPYDRTGKTIYNRLDISDIPNGMVEVPFTTDTGLSLKFIAGFIGAYQDILEDSDGESVVSPMIEWLITDDMKKSS